MRTLFPVIVALVPVFFLGLHITENFQASGYGVQDKYNDTMRISIQSSPTNLNLQPLQDRQIHLRFFDAYTNRPIENVVFAMNVTKGHQVFLYNYFYTKSGSFTLNLKPGERYLWSASPDHDPIDGLYYSQGDQIDIDTPYLTGDSYHFEFNPVIWTDILAHQKAGTRFETTLDLLDTYNKTIAPNSSIDNAIRTDSPLKQFKSGIASKDVQCNNNMKVIIKKSNGLPACVKPESVSRLLIRGWAMLSLKDFGYNPGRGPVTLANAPENSCGQFRAAPQSHNSTRVPVLLMDSNSTACARLTFTVVSNYKDCNGHTCQGIIDLNSTLPIGNLHYEKHDNMFSVSAGKDYTNSFQITVVPQTVDLENFPIGSNFTVTYIIRPLPNATGFYDQSIPKLACERYPLAVGYAADQVNYSNFSYIDPLNPPCASAGLYNLMAVEISGMIYKEVSLP